MALPPDYQVLNVAGAIIGGLGLLAIAVGAYLTHDSRPGHTGVGKVAEALGWVSWLAVSVVNTQLAAELGVDCNVFGRRCDELSNAPGYLWTYVVGPIVLDCVWGACAHAAGWIVAKVVKRSRA